jgi:AraC family transcriptional regulator, regulatory protein of adaptative response / DNA-3-methyladenine glycosylase II
VSYRGGRLGDVILPEPDVCYRAMQGRDARFDGRFYIAVKTTRVYCRPSCPARTPKPENVRFYPSAAAAQRNGFRACKRCRPDASPGSPEWDVRGDLAGRALRLIGDGVIDRDGVPGLARRLGYSERQVNRSLIAEVGAGPLALARAQRAQTARVLLETSELPAGDVAFAAGFASIRQFNDTIRDVFDATPTQLRSARRQHAATTATPGTLELRLPYRAPMSLATTLEFLAARAIPGVEAYDGTRFIRSLRLPGGPGIVEISPGETSGGGKSAYVRCRTRLTDQRDLVAAVSRVRRLLDLDADPSAVDDVLSHDRQLEAAVRANPGLRSPGAVDGFEMAMRAIVGQQISVAGARTVLGRIVAEHGAPTFDGETLRLFPSPEVLADVETLPTPKARLRTVRAVARAIATGELALDPGADRQLTRRVLLALPGVGPWTADYLAMRALADPDVLLRADLGVAKSARHQAIEISDGRPDWAPWRSYATHHLWTVLHAPQTNSPQRKDQQ